MKDVWKQFHPFKKENQLKRFLVHTPSIDPNDILVVQYEIRAPGVLQAALKLFPPHSHYLNYS